MSFMKQRAVGIIFKNKTQKDIQHNAHTVYCIEYMQDKSLRALSQ